MRAALAVALMIVCVPQGDGTRFCSDFHPPRRGGWNFRPFPHHYGYAVPAYDWPSPLVTPAPRIHIEIHNSTTIIQPPADAEVEALANEILLKKWGPNDKTGGR